MSTACSVANRHLAVESMALTVSSYILVATKASVLEESNEVIGSAPIRTKALDAISIAEFATVLAI